MVNQLLGEIGAQHVEEDSTRSRPHSSLDGRTPSEFAIQIAASRDLDAT
jgi:transposase InsO family protein